MRLLQALRADWQAFKKQDASASEADLATLQ